MPDASCFRPPVILKPPPARSFCTPRINLTRHVDLRPRAPARRERGPPFSAPKPSIHTSAPNGTRVVKRDGAACGSATRAPLRTHRTESDRPHQFVTPEGVHFEREAQRVEGHGDASHSSHPARRASATESPPIVPSPSPEASADLLPALASGDGRF